MGHFKKLIEKTMLEGDKIYSLIVLNGEIIISGLISMHDLCTNMTKNLLKYTS